MGVRDAAGRGLVAGFAGTVALTASQRIEMRVTGRPPSDLPARVAEALLGVSPRGRSRALVAFATHWFNNTTSGLGRALVAGVGLRGAPAAGATFVLYVGGSTLLFSRLGLAPPPWRRSARQVATELLHAGVYSIATSTAYERLEPPKVTFEDSPGVEIARGV
jgi:hypothetical protein